MSSYDPVPSGAVFATLSPRTSLPATSNRFLSWGLSEINTTITETQARASLGRRARLRLRVKLASNTYSDSGATLELRKNGIMVTEITLTGKSPGYYESDSVVFEATEEISVRCAGPGSGTGVVDIRLQLTIEWS